MDISKISSGKNPPHELNVIIEVPMGSDPVKYEIDKDSGAVFVDRFLGTSMFYPCNYGFVPHTLSDDGDPMDVLVLCHQPLIPGSVIPVRPIGVLMMEDESGQDEKVLAVPTQKMTPLYDTYHDYTDVPELQLKQIEHFFTHYKDLEKGKWVKVTGWRGVDEAKAIVVTAVAAAA